MQSQAASEFEGSEMGWERLQLGERKFTSPIVDRGVRRCVRGSSRWSVSQAKLQ